MPTAVEGVRPGRAIWHIRAPGHRQSVHIGAEADGVVARSAAAQRANHAGTADAGTDLDTPTGEQLGNLRGGTGFVESDFRMGMEIMAPAHQQRQFALQIFKSTHPSPVGMLLRARSR